MQLPPVTRLLTEDFKDQASWIQKLLYPLNQVFQALSSGLKNNITFTENIACQIKTVSFNNNTSSYPLRFKSTLSTKPTGLVVINIQDISSSPQPLSTAVFATWSYDAANNQHNISALTGLVSGQQYSLTVLVF